MKDLLKKFIVALGSMFQDAKPDAAQISIGRVAFGVVFAAACYHWLQERDLPATMFETLCALLAYVTATKVADIFRSKAAP